MVQVTLHDPWRTLSIILAFLCAYNISLGLVHTLVSLVSGASIQPIDRVWDVNEVHFAAIPGYRAFFVHAATAIISIPLEVLLVQRTKLILDFVMTIQFCQVLFTWLYSNKFPKTWTWWFTWLICSIVMVFGGEYACMQVELKPIVFGSSVQASESAIQHKTIVKDSQLQSERHSNEEIELQEQERLMEEGTSKG